MGKRVLHVVNSSFTLPYYFGNQLLHFKDLGYEFYIACPPDKELYKFCEEKKATALDLPITRSISPFKDLRAIAMLFKYIKQHKIDVVIGHTPKGGLIAMTAAKIAGVKERIYFRHGLLYETAKGRMKRMLYRIEKYTGNLAVKVVCVSPSVLKVSEKLHLSPPSKHVLLASGTCNGIDTQVKFNATSYSKNEIETLKTQYQILEHEKIIGFVGRVVQDKGIEELVEAWNMISHDWKEWKLMVVGPIEDRDSINAKVKEQIINDKAIVFTGHVDRIAPLYKLMDIFILPSYREGFPTVVLEASAMELPIITTKSTGCIDAIIADKTGLFTKIKPEDIAHQLTVLMKNESLRHDLGQEGRRWVVENFDHKIVWKAIEEQLLPKV